MKIECGPLPNSEHKHPSQNRKVMITRRNSTFSIFVTEDHTREQPREKAREHETERERERKKAREKESERESKRMKAREKETTSKEEGECGEQGERKASNFFSFQATRVAGVVVGPYCTPHDSIDTCCRS